MFCRFYIVVTGCFLIQRFIGEGANQELPYLIKKRSSSLSEALHKKEMEQFFVGSFT